MTEYFIAQNLSVTIQAPVAVTGAAAGVLTVGSNPGLTTGDIVLVASVGGITGASGKWQISVSGTSITLKSLTTGATATFTGTYTSGGTITHIGHVTTALTMDNTVFPSTSFNFALKTVVSSLPTGVGVRIAVQDTGDGFVADVKPGPVVFTAGSETAATPEQVNTYTQHDCPCLRMGSANNALRAEVYLEPLGGGTPSAGSSVTFSTWVEA